MLKTTIETEADKNVNSMLQAVIKAPHDDTLRLIYADALEERGDGDDVLWATTIRHAVRWEAEGWRQNWVAMRDDKKSFERDVNATIKKLGKNPVVTTGVADYYPFRHWAHWHKGFIDEVYPHDLAEWERLAEVLYWHPDQTVTVRDWEETGGGILVRNFEKPRPCPPTAHPVRKVVFSRRPPLGTWGRGSNSNSTLYFLGDGDPAEPDVELPNGQYDQDQIVRICLDKRWPHLTFEWR